MIAALAASEWDAVFSDFSMPTFSAQKALETLQQSGLDLPFIIVSGAIGEEDAVQAMKAGAHDYIMKDNLTRLVPAIERELLQAERRRQRILAEEALRRSEASNKRLYEQHATLAEIGRIVSSSVDMEDVYERFAAEVRKLVEFSRITLGLIDHTRDFFEIAYSMGFGLPPRKVNEVTPLRGTVMAEVATERRSKVYSLAEDVRIESLPLDLQAAAAAGIRSVLYVPLISKDEVIGGLAIASVKQGYYSESDLAMAESVAAQIAGAIANSRLYADRQSLQEQLLQSQKMEAVGKLAGGIAHDFNNLLTPIMGYTQIAIATGELPDKIRNNLQQVYKAATRASDLVRQLLVFSRQEIIEPTEINLNQLILEMNRIIHRVIGEDIELVTITPPDLGIVKTDPVQIEQVLVNLAVNARDAMPEGGKLIIETGNVQINADFARQNSNMVAGDYVMLRVQDTGMGMNEEVKARIFDPFFTTKGVGKGTGLGLSTCYGIVSRHGGCITVDSEPGNGSTFTIYLPGVASPHQTGQDAKPSNMTLPKPSDKVLLLVEDETMVREVAACVLRESGYNVLEAVDGADGLRIATERSEDKIDLLLTDVIMPQMSGRELAKKVMSMHPEAKVIYMSGYTDDVLTRRDVNVSGESFIQKPFSPDLLVQKIHAVLNSG
jgi:signal transduction histidine kinase/DNA-binding response OmpR family regulator